MIKASTIKKSFLERTWRRGTNLLNQGRILEHSVVFEREVLQGQLFVAKNDDTVDVSISLKNGEVDSQCTCDVGYQCEHAAALAALYIKRGKGYEQDDQGVTKWLSEIIPSASLTDEQNDHFEIAYILSVIQAKNTRRINIDVARVKRLKNGELSRSTLPIKNLDELLKKPWLAQNQRHLVADIINELATHEAVRSFALLDKLVRSNNVFWQTIQSPTLSTKPEIHALFDWVQEASGLQKLDLQIDNQSKVLVTLPTAPLSVYDPSNHTISKLNIDVEEAIQHKLLEMPSLNPEQRSWVLPQLNAVFSKTQLANKSTNKKSSTNAELIKSLHRPQAVLTLCGADAQSLTEYVTLHFTYHNKTVFAHQPGFFIATEDFGNIPRQKEFEEAALSKLISLGFVSELNNDHPQLVLEHTEQDGPSRFKMERSQLAQFLHQHIKPLKKAGWKIKLKQSFRLKVHNFGGINAHVEERKSGYFTISMNVQINGKSLPLAPILQAALLQLPDLNLASDTTNTGDQSEQDEELFIPVSSDEHVCIARQTLKEITEQFIELTLPTSKTTAKNFTISKFQSHQIFSAFSQSQIEVDGIDKVQAFAEKIENIGQFDKIKPPTSFKGTLRDYQQDGVNWLQFHTQNGLSGMLADDMGLGKTVQAIAHICIEHHQRRLEEQPILILAPTSVVHNWQTEFKQFAPSIEVALIHGSNRQGFKDLSVAPQVVITSYPLLVRDIEQYLDVPFHTIIADEAQYIKNTKTSLYQTITELTAQHRFCLTGTPMENHLGELWAQFNWLLPGLLGNQSQFNKLFKKPIENQKDRQRQSQLNERLRPFILRRDKERIADELGEKTTIVRKVRLEGKQAQMYESTRLSMDKKLTVLIGQNGINRSQIDILSAMLKLRQICCHPDLLSGTHANQAASAKLQLLLDMIDELLIEGRKIIVFSQFTSMLEIIERELKQRKIIYAKLTGQTRNRQQQITEFKQSKVPIFLISLKAGGTGLNLTEADTVIHYDPWWNPAAESQATDRAHRIGQNKPVFVYKLVVEGSIEEKILELQAQKSNLAKTLLSDASESDLTRLTQEHIKVLMQPLDLD